MSGPSRWSINGRFLSQPQTGVQRYARETTRAIDELLAKDETLSRRMAWRILVPGDCADVPIYAAIAVQRIGGRASHAWEQLTLPWHARGGLVGFANLGPLLHPRQIVCVHDANVFLEPDSYAPAFRLAYRAGLPVLARRARAVTTVSAFSSAMLKHFKITGGGGSRVIANGHEHALRWDAARSRFAAHGAFRRPFVFALGSRAKHKQIDLLVKIAPALDHLGLDLIVSGGTSSIFSDASVSGSPNVFTVGFVGDDDLAALFSQALCFAFPSRTEGFGLPLLEAMVHGAPIVASDCASMPEVCGDAALLVPPDEPDAWLAAIGRLAADEALRRTLRANGRKRYPQFSWTDGAERYLALAQEISATVTNLPDTSAGANHLRHPTAL